MAYYYRSFLNAHEGESEQCWKIDDDEAIQLGVINARNSPGSYFSKENNKNVWDTMKQRTPWFEENRHPFTALDIAAKQYYPRLARPISFLQQKYMRSPSADIELTTVALGVGQATSLMRRLDLICQTIHPELSNFDVYGHEIRNLLILAATEVESHWRGVLIANGTTRNRLSTNDYVRLLGPMRLNEYTVGFTSFPWLSPLRPFDGWDASNPTETLAWYDAYNSVKHDREGAFAKAKLGYAMCAVSACVVMLVAQFTRSVGLGGKSELSSYFNFPNVPHWEAREMYSDVSEDGQNWSAIEYGSLRLG